MHLQFNKTLSAACAAVIAASMPSCNGYTDDRESARTMDVAFHIVADGFTDTRSSFTWGENEIRDIQIVITEEDGSVFDVLYSDSSSDLGFTGAVGRRYRIWAAANLGGKVDVHDLQDFTAGTRSVTKAGIAASGIPMFNGPDGQEILLTDDSGAVTVLLTRMLARIDLKVETRLLETQSQFNVKSVSIYNAINTYSPFTTAVRQEHTGRIEYTFDSASSSDVSSLNRGGTISLYAFENMQGTLLPGNTDPWKKVPSSLGDAGDYCSYLEVDCTYGYDDITYRMYLGKDATGNFDVERNTVYRVTLMPTEREIRGERGSWKVEAEPWNDVVDVELILDPSTLELKAGGDFAEITSHFLVTYEDGSTELEDAWAFWTSVGDALSYIETAGRTPLDTPTPLHHMEVKGKADGNATIKATAYSGDGEKYTATCDITVSHDPVYSEESEFELAVEPGSATISEGQQMQFTATLIERVYETVDGERTSTEPSDTKLTEVTGNASWSVTSGNEYVTNAGGGVFGWASGPGTATVTVSFDGYSASIEIITTTPEPKPEPKLTANVTALDTWGGNEYPVRLSYDDGFGNISDVTSSASYSIKFTGSIPKALLSWNGSKLVAEDWWGLSGSWVTAGPTYTLTLSYGGLSVEISGEMHGYTHAEVAPEKAVWHYSEIESNGWSGPAAVATLYGSETTEVWTSNTKVTDSGRYTLSNGYLGLGSDIPFHAWFSDPSNGYTREGDSRFDIETNIVTLQVSIYPEVAQNAEVKPLVTSTDSSGEFLGSVGIVAAEEGIPYFIMATVQEIWYEDYKGDAHQLTFSDGSAPSSEVICLSGGWNLKSRWTETINESEVRTIEIDVNGFSASWLWGDIRNH
ncbi:MAG: DUF4906 domain-containing protein [Bacteroidales bacterium]|nr:DUF4906 domain-containing protein [Bacteroidales bacterium]